MDENNNYDHRAVFYKDKKVFIILENAYLKTGRIGKKIELLDSNNHKKYISEKLNLDHSMFRPDIVHQCLLTLFDSPLNKVNCLRVFIRTYDNICIEIKPECRIPRTYKRFSKLMIYLFKKLKVRAENVSKTLLKIVKNPITDHIPINILKIGTSNKAEKVKLKDFLIANLKENNNQLCFVIGAVSKGNPGMENDYVNKSICVSNHCLSASICWFKILESFEEIWNIV